jgi:hypothetical protein
MKQIPDAVVWWNLDLDQFDAKLLKKCYASFLKNTCFFSTFQEPF